MYKIKGVISSGSVHLPVFKKGRERFYLSIAANPHNRELEQKALEDLITAIVEMGVDVTNSQTLIPIENGDDLNRKHKPTPERAGKIQFSFSALTAPQLFEKNEEGVRLHNENQDLPFAVGDTVEVAFDVSTNPYKSAAYFTALAVVRHE